MANFACLLLRLVAIVLTLSRILHILECAVVPDDQLQKIVHELTELEEINDRIENQVADLHEYIFGDEPYEALISGSRYYIPDGALTASSTHEAVLPKCSRIGVPKPPGCHGSAWHAATSSTKAWIQADLGRTFDVHAVATQGRLEHDQWTLTYHIASLQGSEYLFYLDQNHQGIKDFLGNSDRSTVIRNPFTPSIRTRVMRLYPMTWHSYPAIRWDLYGKIALPDIKVKN